MLTLVTKTTQIIMVSYFRPNDFMRSVQSILTHTSPPFHLSIIDNSHGGLDQQLDHYKHHPAVTIYRNKENLGKGTAFMQRYPIIIGNQKIDHFISIDGDVEVYPGWIHGLQLAMHRIRDKTKLAAVAPCLIIDENDSFERQLSRQELIMHKLDRNFQQYLPNIYYNLSTAGPLLLIDKPFFDKIGGYGQVQLYGKDDGVICRAAKRHGRFIGICGYVTARHLNDDATPAYNEWKHRNVNQPVDDKGFWD